VTSVIRGKNLMGYRACSSSAPICGICGCPLLAAPLKLVFFRAGAIFKYMALTVEIPDEAINALRIPASEVEVELKRELALALYARGALSLGKAVEMAGSNRAQFESHLAQRRIERPYNAAELEHDLAWAKGNA
jgi:predicted HTH domain antitoxin